MTDYNYLIHSCFNEVLNGLPESKALTSLLQRKQEIERLFRNLEMREEGFQLPANSSLVADVIDAVLAALDEDEFETRVGVSRKYAEMVLGELRA